MDVNNDSDIALGSWFGKWPVWLRWALFIPLALVGCFAGSFLFLLVISLTGDIREGSLSFGLYRVAQSAILGGLFVYIGSFIAPRYQFIVGIVMLVTAAVILTFFTTLTLAIHTESVWYQLLHFVAALLGGGIALYAVHDILNK